MFWQELKMDQEETLAKKARLEDNIEQCKTELDTDNKPSEDSIETPDHEADAGAESTETQESSKNNCDAEGTKDDALSSCSVEKVADTAALLLEKDVGITEYVSTHAGFSGVIKQRYSDFLVNEINMNGDIVRLTDKSLPEQAKEVISDVLTAENKAELEALKDSLDKKSAVLIKVGEDKEVRSQVHKAIRNLYPGLDSSTLEKDGQRYIRAFVPRPRFGNKRAAPWPGGRSEYCTFVMYKENRDTMEATSFIAKLLKMKTSAFTFAGTKDKRAKTCQEVSVYKVDAERLAKLQKILRNVELGNFRYMKDPVRLGYLKGNHFSIVLRNVNADDDVIESAMASLRETGFINYYGMQRFGTTTVPTHHVGRAFIKCQWKEVVDLIMKPRGKEQDDIAGCRRVWLETKDAKKALSALGRRECIEKHLLHGLMKHDTNDLVNALAQIPRNSRHMYLHSYQSYVWNCIVSRRIKQFGFVPVVGDLVMEQKDFIEGIHDDKKEQQRKLIVVTEENKADYTIHDVVLPLPGFDVQYPQNDVAQWYKDLLKQDDLDVDCFKSKIRDYSLSGDYRRLVIRPSEISWSVKRYNDVTLPLISSDLDRLNNTALPADESDGTYKALILEMSLPSSSYATMAIRDVLKMDTSSAYQTTLNVT